MVRATGFLGWVGNEQLLFPRDSSRIRQRDNLGVSKEGIRPKFMEPKPAIPRIKELEQEPVAPILYIWEPILEPPVPKPTRFHLIYVNNLWGHLVFMAPWFHHFGFLQKIILFMLLVVTCPKSLSSHDEECLALYHFKQSFPHASVKALGFRKFDSWKITSNASLHGSGCCSWDGVVCSNQEGDVHVIGLDLSDSFLYGPLNSSSNLFNLVHLQTLNLAMNNFLESPISSKIDRLKHLRSLNLSYSRFSGQIPKEISQLTQLYSLDLSGNPLKLQNPSLEKLVKNLTQLKELHLSGVEISSSVPHFLANFSSLRSIFLRNCLLRNEFPTAILQLPKLKFLDVASNSKITGVLPEFHNNSLLEDLNLFSTGFSGIIPKSIENLNHLIHLSLGGCSFSGPIPGSLANMTQLTILDLSQNEFTGTVPSLVSLTELTTLDLSDSNFDKRCLPDWLAKLTRLNKLNVYRMNLYCEIPSFIANLTSLSVLGMRKNYLFGHIPSWFMNLTELSEINLSQNHLEGPISRSFSNFKGLQDLRLQRNNFSGRVDIDMFLGFNKLESLLLGGNRISIMATKNYTNGTLPELKNLDLSSCNLREFPAFLHFQHKLRILFLYNNKIDGLIPEWSWNKNLDTLEMIDLSFNFITGFQQHQHFLPWARMKYFSIAANQLQGRLPLPPKTMVYYDVSYNALEGEIPPLICEVKSLQLLDLSSNNISGNLPLCFGNLSNSLLVLDLKRNNFQGPMMNAFTHGSPLKRIDLSENQFVGQISKSLTNCTNLEVLSLGDNSFEDTFPFWLGTLDKLQVLILRSNKFHGAIQSVTTISSQFSNLRIIDLSNNGFSGQLHQKYFEGWRAMKSAYSGDSSYLQLEVSIERFDTVFPYSMTITNKGVKTEYTRILNIFTAIDLSGNKFEGEIPQSLEDLRGLESLNLSNNHFSGRVLSSLGNLKNLESLDLSRNKLSGEIPQQLLQLGFLAILDVSFNQLEGRIPQGKQFDTFENNSYMGNLGLCGKPLSKECQNPKVSTPPQTNNLSESFLPSDRVDWVVIFSGVGGGLAIGIVFGNFLYTRYIEWFFERLRMRKGKWIRPLGNNRIRT
ncbi:hypothetical protein OSB04_006108 [Centaurea solstitialis]|uniref:Leucine-rich repeat-containing N-terminal plant-type domain-containing protein n=1 Tax=Centaurea solstitialis TaxID=347529 RepID=A0AA38U1X4_9ASTR|nr:hypothetical protein OSB04_006108 [Centaurea solstitialis]